MKKILRILICVLIYLNVLTAKSRPLAKNHKNLQDWFKAEFVEITDKKQTDSTEWLHQSFARTIYESSTGRQRGKNEYGAGTSKAA